MHPGHLIAGRDVSTGTGTFEAVAPATRAALQPAFLEAGPDEADAALRAAAEAFESYRALPAADRARFLRRIATEIEALGDALLQRTMQETGLPEARLAGERARTTNQLRMFADLLDDGSWLGIRIDRGDPTRQPLPKPDLRRTVLPLGPVVVFGASNFPYAFSTAGGDTASALAAGCPVVVKGHPAHPGTSAMIAGAVAAAAQACGIHPGVFGHLQGTSHELGRALVTHDLTAAVGFTGSLRAGRALFDAAASRSVPIPVYAEMGSVNPVFVLPGALAERAETIAAGLVASTTLGVGQFCTNPGLVFTVDGDGAQRLLEAAAGAVRGVEPGTMLYAGVCSAFRDGVESLAALPGVEVVGRSATDPDPDGNEADAWVLTTDAATFAADATLAHEVFGPATLVVRAPDVDTLIDLARGLDGQLTASVHATDDDLAQHGSLVRALERIAGRLVFNGYPTGVEVTHAMHHGGPYPAATDVRSTSVGTAALERFVRPVCFQDAPVAVLPPELRDDNPLGVWRLVDGELTREALR